MALKYRIDDPSGRSVSLRPTYAEASRFRNNSAVSTPEGEKKVQGFNITLYGAYQSSGRDATLANEAGDVMYYMEYNKSSVAAGSDDPKNDSYTKKGGAGEYSESVEDTYESRKTKVQNSPDKQQAAQNLDNPYPLPQNATK